WTATDACGNAASCSQTITVQDTTAPVITCADGMTLECPATPVFSPPTVTDLCDAAPVVTFVEATTPGDCAQGYSVTRTWTATDACGNAASCSQTITVQDTTVPVITCAGAMTVECPVAPEFPPPTVSDLCDAAPAVTFVEVTTPGGCAQEYRITRTWTATDACGNAASCSQTITVEDTTAPVMVIPPDVILECPADTRPAATGMATATDSCGPVGIRHSDAVQTLCGGAKVITRTWTAADECGNSVSQVQGITLEDRTPPEVFCGVVSTYTQGGYGGSGTPAEILEANYIRVFPDGVVVGVDDPSNGTAIPNGLRWEGNAAGLMAIRAFLSQGGGTSGAIGRDALNPLEDCGGGELAHQALTLSLTIRFNELGVIGVGPNNFGSLVYTRAGDSLSGSTVSGLLEAANRALAGFELPAGHSYSSLTALIDNLNQAFHEYGSSAWAANYLGTPRVIVACASDVPPPDRARVRAYDACGGPVSLAVLPDVISEVTCPHRYMISRVWLAWDDCGNTNSCVYHIEVNDTNPPVVVGPVLREVPAGEAWDFTEPEIMDACGTVALTGITTVTNTTGSTTLVAARTWEVVDECGNTATYTQTVRVVDQAAVAQSAFDVDDEGWQLASGSTVGEPTYFPTGGQGSGFVVAGSEGGAADWFWEAPVKFLGNRLSCYDGVLEFALKREVVLPGGEPVEVTLRGAGMILTLQLPQPASTDWTTYKVRLNEHSGWHMKALGRKATQAEVAMVLSTLSNLRICGGECAIEMPVGLDNVALAQPAADPGSAWVLELDRVGPGSVRVRWPALAVGFELEAADSLTSPHWSPVSVTPVIRYGLNEVELGPTQHQRYFRLRKNVP
ncbi:MAG: hypothetical protein JXQ71_03450, partial [Verrucomicrobia bacterium]|nr:hypothetical protein [Verrucomicrobiota bacterium]